MPDAGINIANQGRPPTLGADFARCLIPRPSVRDLEPVRNNSGGAHRASERNKGRRSLTSPALRELDNNDAMQFGAL